MTRLRQVPRELRRYSRGICVADLNLHTPGLRKVLLFWVVTRD